MLSRFSLSVIFLASTIALVDASTSVFPADAFFRRLSAIQAIAQKRQSSGNGSIPLSEFPAQCRQGCAVSISALNTCTAASCICNSKIGESLEQCIICSVNSSPQPSIIQEGQQALDAYNGLCKGTGVSSLSLTVTNTGGSTSFIAVTDTTSTSTTTTNSFIGPTKTIDSLSTTTNSIATPTGTQRSAALGIRASTGQALMGLVIAVALTSLA